MFFFIGFLFVVVVVVVVVFVPFRFDVSSVRRPSGGPQRQMYRVLPSFISSWKGLGWGFSLSHSIFLAFT